MLLKTLLGKAGLQQSMHVQMRYFTKLYNNNNNGWLLYMTEHV